MFNKKLFLILAGLYALFIVLFASGLSSDLKKNNGNFNFSINSGKSVTHKIDTEKIIGIGSSNDIKADSVTGDVNVWFEKRKDVSIHVYGEIKTGSEKEPELKAVITGNTLKIYVDNINNSHGNSVGPLKYDIIIPESFRNSLTVSNVSGDTVFSGNGIKLNELVFSNVSGDTYINDAACSRLKSDTVSGSVSFKNSISEHAVFNSVSGDIKTEKFKSAVKADSVSGDIVLGLSSLIGDCRLNSVSGDISLTIAVNSEFILNSKSVSGDIEIPDFAVQIEKKSDRQLKGRTPQGRYMIDVNSISGDIGIYAAK